MFDVLISLAESLWGLLEILAFVADLAAASANLYAWIRGRQNRSERRAARQSGRPVPPRDRWNRRVLWLSVLVVTLTAGLLAWRLIVRA